MVVVFLLAEGTAGEGGAPWQLWVTIPLVATASAALSSILGRYQASAASLLLVVLLTGPGLTRVAPPAIGLVFLPLYPASTCAWSAQGAQPGLHPDTYLAAALVMAVAAVWTSMRLGRTGKD
ncbi:hypothetical protein JW921_06640, partial [Candidatus Fermentibacterales bacterium]|nr:hypothetical protein [Candidatus Fermentibacterales bacterium]